MTLSLIAGLVYWITGAGSNASEWNRDPFYGAIVALASTPAIQCQSSTTGAESTSLDAWVTSQGEVSGTITVAGVKFSLLVVGGKTYVKPPADLLSGSEFSGGSDPGSSAALLANRWITGGDSDSALGSGTTPQLSTPQLSTPLHLAQTLLTALNNAGTTFPPAGSQGTRIGGVPALTAVTPLGDISVSRDEPYRLLRIAPPSTTSASATHATSTSSGSPNSLFSVPSAVLSELHRLPAVLADLAGGSGGSAGKPSVRSADYVTGRTGNRTGTNTGAGAGKLATPRILPAYATAGSNSTFGAYTTQEPEAEGELNAPFKSNITNTGQLSKAVSEDVQFTRQGNANLNCSTSGCLVTATVTGQVTSTSSNTQVLGGTVSAQLAATLEADGIPSAGCEGGGQLPVNGTSTISCEDSAAGGLIASQQAVKKAQALSQSEAEGGASVPYQVDVTGEALVTATAVTQVEVQELVEEQQQEQQNADDAPNPYATESPSPSDTATGSGVPSGSASSSTSSSSSASPGVTENPDAQGTNVEAPSEGAAPTEGAQRQPSSAASAQTATEPDVSVNPYEPVPLVSYAAPPTSPVQLAPGTNPDGAGQPNATGNGGQAPSGGDDPAGGASPSPTKSPKDCLDSKPAGADSAGLADQGWITYSAGPNGRAGTAQACLKNASGPPTAPSAAADQPPSPPEIRQALDVLSRQYRPLHRPGPTTSSLTSDDENLPQTTRSQIPKVLQAARSQRRGGCEFRLIRA